MEEHQEQEEGEKGKKTKEGEEQEAGEDHEGVGGEVEGGGEGGKSGGIEGRGEGVNEREKRKEEEYCHQAGLPICNSGRILKMEPNRGQRIIGSRHVLHDLIPVEFSQATSFLIFLSNENFYLTSLPQVELGSQRHPHHHRLHLLTKDTISHVTVLFTQSLLRALILLLIKSQIQALQISSCCLGIALLEEDLSFGGL